MTNISPLTINGTIAGSPLPASTDTKRWYCSNLGFLGADGEFVDLYSWEPSRGPDDEYSCDVTTSGMFMDTPEGVRESIRSALDKHLDKHLKS